MHHGLPTSSQATTICHFNMHLISNRQRREVVEFLTAFIELTDDGGNNRIYNLKRRAGLLVRKLKDNQEISNETAKAIKKTNK